MHMLMLFLSTMSGPPGPSSGLLLSVSGHRMLRMSGLGGHGLPGQLLLSSVHWVWPGPGPFSVSTMPHLSTYGPSGDGLANHK